MLKDKFEKELNLENLTNVRVTVIAMLKQNHMLQEKKEQNHQTQIPPPPACT